MNHDHKPPLDSWEDIANLAFGAKNKSLSDVYDRIDVLLCLVAIAFTLCIPAIVYTAYHLAAKS